MNMQTDAANGPHCPVADGSSSRSALASLGYSDLVERHIQNQVTAGFPLPPPPFGDDTIILGHSQMSCNDAVDEYWSTPTASYTFESPKTGVDSMFEATNCCFEGIPFNATTRWDFNRGVVSSPDLQESSIMMNEWMSGNPGPSRFTKELSLSFTTSELSSSGASSYSSLHKRHVGSDNTSCSSNNFSLNFTSCKALPVATLLSGSRFFRAMQEILAEFASDALGRMSFSDHRHGLKPSSHTFNIISCEIESKKKHLMSLLQVVDDQYNRCLDEIYTVISAFHAVTELDPNLHARFALPTITAMYRNLRERISSHILAMGAAPHVEEETREDKSFESSFIQKQWALQQLKKRDHQLWRPQRGLPERSVSVLRAWMFQNFLHPYPKDAEKHLLALKSGLTRSQVSNWFINARVRLWKPMIEEMYAEMNRRKAPRSQEEGNGCHRKLLRFESRRFTVD